MRGNINLWLSRSALRGWYYESDVKQRGGQKLYSDLAILTCLTIKKVFHLALRQCEGFIKSVFARQGIELPVPDYTILSRRASQLNVVLPRLIGSKADEVDIVVDSTGLKVYGEGEWKVRKHGVGKHRTWMKLHLGIAAVSPQILATELTTNAIDDATAAENLVPSASKQGKIKRFIGDGGYDKINIQQKLHGADIAEIIPPQRNAVIKKEKEPCWQARNEAIRQIQDTDRKQWKVMVGYHKRSLVETAMFRYKTIIGSHLQSRKLQNQITEAKISCNILNQLLQLIKPVSIKKV